MDKIKLIKCYLFHNHLFLSQQNNWIFILFYKLIAMSTKPIITFSTAILGHFQSSLYLVPRKSYFVILLKLKFPMFFPAGKRIKYKFEEKNVRKISKSTSEYYPQWITLYIRYTHTRIHRYT